MFESSTNWGYRTCYTGALTLALSSPATADHRLAAEDADGPRSWCPTRAMALGDAISGHMALSSARASRSVQFIRHAGELPAQVALLVGLELAESRRRGANDEPKLIGQVSVDGCPAYAWRGAIWAGGLNAPRAIEAAYREKGSCSWYRNMLLNAIFLAYNRETGLFLATVNRSRGWEFSIHHVGPYWSIQSWRVDSNTGWWPLHPPVVLTRDCDRLWSKARAKRELRSMLNRQPTLMRPLPPGDHEIGNALLSRNPRVISVWGGHLPICAGPTEATKRKPKKDRCLYFASTVDEAGTASWALPIGSSITKCLDINVDNVCDHWTNLLRRRAL